MSKGGLVRMTEPEATRLMESLRQNEALWECLRRVSQIGLADWYIGAGCIAQTIWNIAHNKPVDADIVDYDLAYYDPDLSAELERATRDEARQLVGDLPVKLDVKNQARVHLWYPERFGDHIQPYRSTEDAIQTWPTTATAIGVRLAGRDLLDVFAPFGLEDVFGLVVRANRVQVPREVFEMKAKRWRSAWPKLTVLPWEEGVGIEAARREDLIRREVSER